MQFVVVGCCYLVLEEYLQWKRIACDIESAMILHSRDNEHRGNIQSERPSTVSCEARLLRLSVCMSVHAPMTMTTDDVGVVK